MKTVSATEAKNRLGALIAEVAGGAGDIIIENHGAPRAALISYEAYMEMLEVRERQWRQDAKDALQRLRDEVRARNQDLTDGEAEAIAEDVSREAIARIVARNRRQRASATG